MKDPIIEIQKKMGQLTETQRKVADYILKHPLDVAFLTVDQLANLVNTSTTTIMRLTFNLGYSGYSEFQKGLQENLKNQAAPQTRLEANIKDINKENLWGRYTESQIKNLQNTIELISEELLEKVEKHILSANQIICTSVRSGLPVAQFLSHGLNRLFGNTRLVIADLSDWVDNVINIGKDDLLIAITFPRYAKRIMDLAETVKKNGGKIIAITDSYSSPIATYSDIILPCNSSSIAFHNSVVSSMFVADYLVSALAIKYPEQTKERLDKINKILLDIDYHSMR